MMSIQKQDEIHTFHTKDVVTADLIGRISSYTRQLTKEEVISPMTFFQQIEDIAKNRSFWGEPNNQFFIVGAGAAYKISATTNRYRTTKEKWLEVKHSALIHNEYTVPGTGLVALGGMSFDPKRKKDPMWQAYPNSELIVPKVMLTVKDNDYFFTTNVFLDAEHIGQSFADVHAQFDDILKHPNKSFNKGINIVEKSEQAVAQWKASVQKAIDEINEKRAEKIVLARELKVTLKEQPPIDQLIKDLIHTQPTSYIFAIERGDHCFIGATPERLVRLEGKHLLSTCLAGTAPRGDTKEADETVRKDLFNDPKNRLEHDHVVQMINEAISPYCEKIQIPQTPTVKTLKNLHHLYTPVTAQLKKEATIFHMIEALHPTPALGGVPRPKALAFIREHESFDRGWFGAPVGWLDGQDNGEFAVAIRSGLIQRKVVSLFAGCGVMGDSNIEEEYVETGVKFLPMLNVLEGNYDIH